MNISNWNFNFSPNAKWRFHARNKKKEENVSWITADFQYLRALEHAVYEW